MLTIVKVNKVKQLGKVNNCKINNCKSKQRKTIVIVKNCKNKPL
jgi:hypothetical protein